MDAVGLRVRQEMPRLRPRTFLVRVWEGAVPPACRRHLTMPTPATVASGSNIPSGSLMSSVPPSEFAYPVWW